MKSLVIGILAPVDSGKTTLSEGLLYCGGALKKLGRVDHGDAFLDSHSLERQRGITIFSKQAVFNRGATEITLLDTPGHVDFSPEMERTLPILDYAILVISGADGVQSHTETLWRLLRSHGIPTFLFVNKMDWVGVDRVSLMEALKHRLNQNCIEFNAKEPVTAFWENIALCEDVLLNHFLENGQISDKVLSEGIARCKVFPCYFGSALRLQGVEDLLRGLEKYTESPIYPSLFGARVFKIARDEQGNRLTYLKITGGGLKVKTLLSGATKDGKPWAEKINQIRIYSGSKFQVVEEAWAGKVCALIGLSQTYSDQRLGWEIGEIGEIGEIEWPLPLLEPVLTYRVKLPPEKEARTVLPLLQLLAEEEPQLHVLWLEALQEIQVQLMGQVQLEVLQSLMLQRFKIEVSFGQGQILYKETIRNRVEGLGHFEPPGHYGEVHLLLEPGEPGSGLCFESTCKQTDLEKNWQHLILSYLAEKLPLGVLTGSPMTDLKITLVGGRAHQKYTEGGDLRQAAYRAVRQGLKQAQSVLLEPWYDFCLTVPAAMIGRALWDLRHRNGRFGLPEVSGGLTLLRGSLPAGALGDYPSQVRGYTSGRGGLSYTLKGYAPCHNQEAVMAALGYESDGDLANPADSIFCRKGWEFRVPWDQVKAHIQVGSRLCQQVLPESASRPGQVRTEDEELLAIYQRTYGSIRRDLLVALPAPTQEKQAEPFVATPEMPEQAEYLLIDGYNIIFAWEELAILAGKSLDTARQRLINILCNYQGFCQCELILVFDAYKVKKNQGYVEKIYNISVVYTQEAETADMYIEKVTHKLGKKRPVRVATSDGLEQMIILSQGARRVSAREFQREVQQVEKTMGTFYQMGGDIERG